MKGILSRATIYEVTEELIQQIIDSEVNGVFDGPHELMWFYDEKAKKYIGCDNTDGNAWIEEFDTRMECVAWLLELDENGGIDK